MKRTPFLRQLETQLAARRERLLRTLVGDMSDLRSAPSGAVGDELEQAIDGEHAELCAQLAEVETRELRQIDQALERLHRGDYGRCQSCGQAIARARLQAAPYAAECIGCARRRDHEERPGAASRWQWSDQAAVQRRA